MSATLEVLFAPAEFAALQHRDLTQTTCVVFDIFRATSTIVTALANGATAVIPVAEISDAVAIRRDHPEILLAGERDGLRITAKQTGEMDFDLGNSPREFTAARVHNKTVVLTTTNGSRALRACAHAGAVLIGSFLNLHATAEYLRHHASKNILLVCSGTGEQSAYEDILGAGALIDFLPRDPEKIADSATAALQIYQQHSQNLAGAIQHSRNGKRLLSMPDLCDDVSFCHQRDLYSFVAKMENGAVIKVAV